MVCQDKGWCDENDKVIKLSVIKQQSNLSLSNINVKNMA